MAVLKLSTLDLRERIFSTRKRISGITDYRDCGSEVLWPLHPFHATFSVECIPRETIPLSPWTLPHQANNYATDCVLWNQPVDEISTIDCMESQRLRPCCRSKSAIAMARVIKKLGYL